jgi:catechol 2,3-dioxygenase-like lactoylglutathione lyase family enzyme
MASVTGIGGIFFKVQDPDVTRAWYRDHLGIALSDYGGWSSRWRNVDDPDRVGRTEWSPFPAETGYFQPSDAAFMINYRVDDLDGLLEQLKAAGIEQIGATESYSYGRFAWVLDPNGIKVELWEPTTEPS